MRASVYKNPSTKPSCYVSHYNNKTTQESYVLLSRISEFSIHSNWLMIMRILVIRFISVTCRKFMTSAWSYPGGVENDSPVADCGRIKVRNSPAYNSEATNIRRFISTPLTGPSVWWLDSRQTCLYFTHKPAPCLCVCVCEATAEANLKQRVPG